MLEEKNIENPPLFRSRKQLWFSILLGIGLIPSIIPFALFTHVSLSKYREMVEFYNKFERRPDQLHLANFNQGSDIVMSQEDLLCTGWDLPEFNYSNLLDASSLPTTSSHYEEIKYYLALSEDEVWVPVIVHPMVCNNLEKDYTVKF